MNGRRFRLGVLWAAMLWSPAASAVAADHVTMRRDGREFRLHGKVIVTAKDGGLLLATADGVQWSILPEELVRHTTDDAAFAPLSAEKAAEAMLAELPRGFAVYKTKHYVICYNTNRAYAKWCAGLYERLYAGFTSYWAKRGIELREPDFPLLTVVFADKASYVRQTRDELGNSAEAIVGYYSLRTNRVTMYDLTGIAGLRREGDVRGSPADITRMLARPEAAANVATIVHEATHQIAFNCGLQTRFADNPLWVSEGLAVFFETPDLSSRRGWRKIGVVHPTRLAAYRAALARNQTASLKELIADDARFRNAQQAGDAYAQAWALNYFLLRRHSKQYAEYLKRLGEKKPFVWNTPEERLREFQAVFGDDLGDLEADFVRTIQNLRVPR
jgi:hypothetical protein